VNGTQGIGTGWSTSIPPHNPLDVLQYIRAKLEGDESRILGKSIKPFVVGYRGKIEKTAQGYVSCGSWREDTKSTIVIDELPFRCWTASYKDTLLKMRDRGEISHIVENHTTSEVSFTVQMKAAYLRRLKQQQGRLEKAFKLRSNILTTNMHAFDALNDMQKFDSAESVADLYFPVRMELYRDRKSVMESEMKHSATKFRNKARFVQAVTSGDVDFVSGRKSKAEAEGELRSLGFATAAELDVIRSDNVVAARRRDIDFVAYDPDQGDSASQFDYLLNMPLSSLTSDKIRELNKDASKKEEELAGVQSKSAEDLWISDLDRLEPQLESLIKERSRR